MTLSSSFRAQSIISMCTSHHLFPYGGLQALKYFHSISFLSITRGVNVIFIYFSDALRRRSKGGDGLRNSERYQKIRDQTNTELKAELDTDLTTETENDPEDEMGTEYQNDPKAEVSTEYQNDP